MNDGLFMGRDMHAIVQKDSRPTERFCVQMVAKAITERNWVVGEAAHLWFCYHSKGRGDSAFCEILNAELETNEFKPEMMRKCRTVYNKVELSSELKGCRDYANLSWSHFFYAVFWDDGPAMLRWASESGATVSEMRDYRARKIEKEAEQANLEDDDDNIELPPDRISDVDDDDERAIDISDDDDDDTDDEDDDDDEAQHVPFDEPRPETDTPREILIKMGEDKILSWLADNSADTAKLAKKLDALALVLRPAKMKIPPTREEVAAYCRDNYPNVDPDKFWLHYNANGWVRGKNKMRDWHSSVELASRERYFVAEQSVQSDLERAFGVK